jgi:hypothetical protein
MDIKEELLKIKDSFKTSLLMTIEVKNELIIVNKSLRMIECKTRGEIANAKDGFTYKPRYSNDSLRETEYISRIENNEDYKKLRILKIGLDEKLSSLEVDLEIYKLDILIYDIITRNVFK